MSVMLATRESDAPWAVLDRLGERGWSIAITPAAPASNRALVLELTAKRRGREVELVGRSVEELAVRAARLCRALEAG